MSIDITCNNHKVIDARSLVPNRLAASVTLFLWVLLNFCDPGFYSLQNGTAGSFWYYAGSTITNVTFLALCCVARRQLEPVLRSQTVLFTAGVACSCGTAVSGAGTLLGLGAPAALAAGTCLTGSGSAILLLALGKAYVDEYSPSVLAELLAGFFVQFILYSLLSTFPQGAVLALTTLAPVATAFLLVHPKHAKTDTTRPTSSPEDMQALRRAIAKLAATSLGFMLVYGIYKGTRWNTPFMANHETTPWLIAATTIVIFAILLFSALKARRLNSALCYRAVFFLFVLFLTLVAVVENGALVAFDVVDVTGFLFRTLLFGFSVQIAVKTGLSAVVAVGTSQMFFKLATLATSFIPLGFQQLTQLEPLQNQVPIVLVAMLTFFYLFVFTEADATRIMDINRTMSPAETAERTCLELARQHTLTERETEVFLLLSQGRSAPRIAQALYLSQGTVNMHLRNVYRKLGIHSKQELLDLVENHKP